MRPILAGYRFRTPLPLFGQRGPRVVSGLILGLAAATSVGGTPARAAVDDTWAGPMIDRMLSEQTQEGGQRRRGRDTADPDDEGGAPQRRTSTKHKSTTRNRGDGRVASLNRDAAPVHLRPLSVIEWARPKFEAVLLPKEVAPPAKEVGPMVASLGRDFLAASPSPAPGLTGDPIRWMTTASIDCLAAPLRGVLTELAAGFGPITVRWTCRSKTVNARVGGAKRSYHLTGDAVDFNMDGNYRAILSFLKGNKLVGGLKHYGHGQFHIDTGPRRTW